MKKRLYCLAFCLALLIPGMQLHSVYAAEIVGTEEITIEQLDVMDIVNKENVASNAAMIQAYTNKIQDLSDSEFDKMIAEMMENTTDVSELKETLAVYGVELGMDETPDASVMSLRPSQVDFTNYYAKRGGDSYYRLFTKMAFDSQELYPGSLDSLVKYFDPDLARYYDYDILSDDAFTLQTDRTKDDGYIIFNFDDELICGVGYQDEYTVVIYAIPLVTGQYIDYGAELGHSYTVTDISINGAIEVLLPDNFGGTIGFEASPREEYWQVSSGSSTFIHR